MRNIPLIFLILWSAAASARSVPSEDVTWLRRDAIVPQYSRDPNGHSRTAPEGELVRFQRRMWISLALADQDPDRVNHLTQLGRGLARLTVQLARLPGPEAPAYVGHATRIVSTFQRRGAKAALREIHDLDGEFARAKLVAKNFREASVKPFAPSVPPQREYPSAKFSLFWALPAVWLSRRRPRLAQTVRPTSAPPDAVTELRTFYREMRAQVSGSK